MLSRTFFCANTIEVIKSLISTMSIKQLTFKNNLPLFFCSWHRLLHSVTTSPCLLYLNDDTDIDIIYVTGHKVISLCPFLLKGHNEWWNLIKLQKAQYYTQCSSRNMVPHCSFIGISWWANLFEVMLLSSLKLHALQAAKIKTAKFTPNSQYQRLWKAVV